MYTVHCTVYISSLLTNNMFKIIKDCYYCTLYIAIYTIYVYRVYTYTVYTRVQCTLYSISCTMYICISSIYRYVFTSMVYILYTIYTICDLACIIITKDCYCKRIVRL